MADAGHITVLVLWEDELKAAVAAIRAMRSGINAEPAVAGEALTKLVNTALSACEAALFGMDHDREYAGIVVSKADRAKFVPRVTEIRRGKKESAQ